MKTLLFSGNILTTKFFLIKSYYISTYVCNTIVTSLKSLNVRFCKMIFRHKIVKRQSKNCVQRVSCSEKYNVIFFLLIERFPFNFFQQLSTTRLGVLFKGIFYLNKGFPLLYILIMLFAIYLKENTILFKLVQ